MFPVQDVDTGKVKIAGTAKAVVIDNIDPFKRGNIRVKTTMLGESGWIPYLMPAGQFTVPAIDDVVYVTTDCGYETNLVAYGVFVKGKDGDLGSPEEFQRHNPTNRGIYGEADSSGNRNIIELDDGKNDLVTDQANATPGIKIQDINGHKIITNGNAQDTSITIESKGGQFVKIVDTPVPTISVEDSNGNKITTSATGMTAEASTGSKLILDSGQVNLVGSTDDLLTLLVDLVTSLSTATYAGFGAPGSNAADLAQLVTKLTALKASP